MSRLLFSVSEEEKVYISRYAKKNHLSMSEVVRTFVAEAIERREDIALAKIADQRLSKREKLTSHEEVCKKLGL
ncbi:MAG: DUF6290 family protein [Bdellovibrionota bacterium]